MSRTCNCLTINTRIRLYFLYGLFFFAHIFCYCNAKKVPEKIKIVWDKEKAIGIDIPNKLLPAIPADSVDALIQIRMIDNIREIGMLGEFTLYDDHTLFKPLIPLSPGEKYQISYRDTDIGHITVPVKASDAPQLLAIYPSADTLPENLLKIYLRFSRPMREGQSQQYIALVNAMQDTVPDVFLDLQPELWNTNRTVLTVWLDPGRIKRELQPNKRRGNPLKAGETYTISISKQWQDARGILLPKTYIKKFATGIRDSISPDISKWILKSPVAGTLKPIEITLNEPLDYFLLEETLKIKNTKGAVIKGTFKIKNNEKTVEFYPVNGWESGKHTLKVEPWLEDRAGNNLDRLFDRDITVNKLPGAKAIYERYLVIN